MGLYLKNNFTSRNYLFRYLVSFLLYLEIFWEKKIIVIKLFNQIFKIK